MPKSLFALRLHVGYADAKLKCTNICLEIILCWQKLKATCRPSSIQQVCFCWEGSRAAGGELKVFTVNAERITVKCSEGSHGRGSVLYLMPLLGKVAKVTCIFLLLLQSLESKKQK